MRLGEGRAVGADEQNRAGAAGHGSMHPRTEVALRLRPEGDLHPRNHFQKRVVRGIRRAAQRDRADAGGERGGDCAFGQSLLQDCCGMRTDCGDEPGFSEARYRGIRQDRDRHGTGVRRGHGHSVVRVASYWRRGNTPCTAATSRRLTFFELDRE